MTLEKIRQLNPNITIHHVNDLAFTKYGRVLDKKSFLDYFHYLDQKTFVPAIKNTYIAHDEDLKNNINTTVFNRIYPNQSLQYGYVNGQNTQLNALEYHKSNEVNLMLTPLVLFLGLVTDIEHNAYHVHKLEAFFIPEYTVIEILNTTLHFSPCKVDDSGFKCGVVLPYGTNMEFVKILNKKSDEDHLMFKTNKWLLAHPENTSIIELGAHVGIIGPNLEIKYKREY